MSDRRPVPRKVVHLLIAVLSSLISVRTMLAQPVGSGINMGELPFGQTFFQSVDSGGPSTIIDLTQPASSAGSLTSATLRWILNNAPCPNGYKIKVVRQGTQLGTFTVVAERGPFPATSGDLTVALNPPVPVLAGDFLAVTQLNGSSSNCGGVGLSLSDSTHSALRMSGDLQTGATNTGKIFRLTQVNLRAASDLPALVGVVPGVGSVQGANGSGFRTAIQVASGGASGQVVSGRLVFHPRGGNASASDPGVNFTLQNRDTIQFSDIGTVLNVSGLGTLDVLSTGTLPLVTVRVFNDNGAAGTQGFIEPVVRPRDAALPNTQVFLNAPHDPATFRMNIGVRTFEQGVTFFAVYIAPNGQSLGPVSTKTYAANYFEQFSLQQFVDNLPASPDALLAISVTAGSAVFYGTTTDNRTNDSAIVIASRP